MYLLMLGGLTVWGKPECDYIIQNTLNGHFSHDAKQLSACHIAEQTWALTL